MMDFCSIFGMFLKGIEYTWRFFAIFFKVDNFWNFLFVFLYIVHQVPSEKGVHSKRKEFAS